MRSNSPAGGAITIELAQEPPAPAESEPGIRCIISDTGPGIPAIHKEQIFDRFVRVNVGGAQVRGTGLGLTFCKLAIEAHNGQIWVEDTRPGQSFCLHLTRHSHLLALAGSRAPGKVKQP